MFWAWSTTCVRGAGFDGSWLMASHDCQKLDNAALIPDELGSGKTAWAPCRICCRDVVCDRIPCVCSALVARSRSLFWVTPTVRTPSPTPRRSPPALGASCTDSET